MQHMKLALAVLVFGAVSAVAQDAPIDDTVAPTPVPSTATFCNRDRHCSFLGDVNATCVADQCVCTTGHDGDLCQFKDGNASTTLIRLNLVVSLPALVCDLLQLEELRTLILARLAEKVVTVISFTRSCGSVTLITDIQVNPSEAATAISNAADAIKTSIVEKSAYTNITDVADVPLSVLPSQSASKGEVCTANAVNTIVAYDNRCIVLECSVGYTLSTFTVRNKDFYACTLTQTRGLEGDDDLSGAAIAAIVVGAVFLTVVVGMLLFFVCMKKDESVQNEPYTEENKAVETA
eukprot:TRINITY_DN213_c0_g1_i1.p2 TRINITY_DN213_c0_g1~~TRINITY_DN213_c0_g1_i1.p2  ORF type:complete len:293 (+),score=111.36 TRINITY_DN213_c0_g1_i1:75-953(+)